MLAGCAPPQQQDERRCEAPAREGRTVTLWHSYRGAEEDALCEILGDFHAEQSEIRVEALAVPNNILASKIATAVPHGNGPDVFVFFHDRIGGWTNEILAPVDVEPGYLPETVAALELDGKTWGLPLSFKSAALYRNLDLAPDAPATTNDLLAAAREVTGGDRFGLVYESGLFYYHSAWFYGHGARLFDDADKLAFESPEAIASLSFVRELRDVMPSEVGGALVSKLFNEGNAAFAISGPWLAGELDPKIRYAVSPLPIVSSTGKPARPFLTVEAAFVSALAKSKPDALAVARRIAGEKGARVRANKGHQAVAWESTWSELTGDTLLTAFRAQLPTTELMDKRPVMRTAWEPADLALKKMIRGGETPERAARAAVRRHAAITRPVPPRASPAPYVVLAIGATLGVIALAIRRARSLPKRETAHALSAWSWIAPAAIATAILIFLPFAVGLVMSLFDHRDGTWTFVGLANFADIVSARTFGPMEPLSFYYALAVTILWTAANVSLHVIFGLALALLLNRPLLKLKPLYRVLLILPWAVPSYITALLWKGLFHKQYGAINGILESLGIEGISWFSGFWTAFFANVCTNAWLGFPFMMVVALGCLQSIPKELHEAAAVDGASAWQRFRHVTLPLLAPAMVPAVLLGIVWTFNQFNIVYLVSGGEPDNSTDILISEAYRWAFARQEQYGYAAAYAALIFVLLLGWSRVSTKLAKIAEST